MFQKGKYMLFRKINAVISLLTTFFVLAHAISISVWMLSKGTVSQPNPILSWILVGLMVAHAFISIELVVSHYMEAGNPKCKHYPKMNASTLVQRISGVLLVIFTGLHVAGASGAMQPPQAVHAVVPPLFFAITMAHVAASTDKAFVTLGIGNAKLVRAVSVIAKVLCALVLIAAIVGFYGYSFKGVGK